MREKVEFPELDDEQRRILAEWRDSLSTPVREVYDRYPPDRFHIMIDSGYRVVIASYDEHLDDETGEPTGEITVTVGVMAKYNPDKVIFFDRKVAGVNPDEQLTRDV